MLENPITSGDSSSGGEDSSSTTEKVLSTSQDTTTTQGSDESPNHDDVDIEAIKAEKRAAVTEAKKRFHESETARAEASTLRATLESAVQKNPDLLLKLQEDDPQLADSISQKLFQGYTVNELVQLAQQEQQVQTQPSSYEDVRKIIREESAAEKRRIEQKQIDRLEVEFFIDHDIDPTSPVYKQIMGTYTKFKPKTFEEASELLELAYAKTQMRTQKPVGDINQVYTPSFGSTPAVSKKSKKGLSDAQKSLGKSLFGLSDKYL